MDQWKLNHVDMKALTSSFYVRWKMHGSSLSLDGNNLYTSKHGRRKDHGEIEHKRPALCVMAHFSPFWGVVLVSSFTEKPVSKKPLSKRFRGAKGVAMCNRLEFNRLYAGLMRFLQKPADNRY